MNNVNHTFRNIILLNVLVYVVTLIIGQNQFGLNIMGTNNAAFNYLGVNRMLVLNRHEYWRVITYAFAHGSLMHLAFNMYALYSLSSVVIRFTNEKFAIITYFVAALVAGIATVVLSNSIAVGASGAIYAFFGVIFYYAFREYRIGHHDMIKALMPTIVINIIITLTPGISIVGHVSGLITGFVLAWIYDRKIKRAYWR